MKCEDRWTHLKRLVECAIKSNVAFSEQSKQPITIQKYCEGKARSYRTILGWMIDLENNQFLMQPDSTHIDDEMFIKLIKKRLKTTNK